MSSIYIPGVYCTRSDYAPTQLISHVTVNIEKLIKFAKDHPDLVSNDNVRFTIWADENGILSAKVQEKKEHPGYFSPQSYDHGN